MASHVQVVLKQDVDNLGVSGDLVKVRPGYARNYLLPRGMAVVATRGNIEAFEHERKLARARADKARAEALQKAETIEGLHFEIAKQAGEEGKLYGSVTAQDVADALEEQGFKVDRKKIQMPSDAIKQLGTHQLAIKLGPRVAAGFTIEVVAAE